MTRLKRVTNKIFGATASTIDDPTYGPEIGQFGSAKLGTYNATDDVAQIQGLSAWDNGWIDAVIPDQQYPTLPEMTGVGKVFSYQTSYLMQEGIAEWDSATEYCKDSIVKYVPEISSQSATASIGDSTGITGASVVLATFTSQITIDGSYTFTYDGNWKYNGLLVNLADYGISYTGTPAINDEIIVTLTTTYTRGDGVLYVSLTDNNLNNNPDGDTVNWEIFILGADKDLSNLTATGKTKVVTLAHELDYSNIIEVSTSSTTNTQTYTCTSDGIFVAMSTVTSNSPSTMISDTIIYSDNTATEKLSANGNYIYSNSRILEASCSWCFLKNETVYYSIYGSGGTVKCKAIFIPFKESL